MDELVISEQLAQRIQAVARQQSRDPESLLGTLLRQMASADEVLLPRPPSSLTDADIELAADVRDPDAYRSAVRAMRPKTYRLARRYWLDTGNIERLSMTDEELDKVFWLIDHEGVPRFKSEMNEYQPPVDPFAGLIGVLENTAHDDLSEKTI